MKFGVKLPHSGPLANPESIRRISLVAERIGFDSVWTHDHISYGRDWLGHRASGLVDNIAKGYEPDFYESVNTLAHVAGLTKAVRLGTSVIVLPLRNPLVLGRQLVTLQALSGNRLVLGVGGGDYPAEFRALQVPYKERGQITEEYLAVLRKIFAGGKLNHHGKYVNVDEAYFYPRVKPPLIFVGQGVIPEGRNDRLVLRVLRRVAKYGDGWLPYWGSPDLIREGSEIIKQFANAYGRGNVEFEVAMSNAFYLADTDEEARRKTALSIQEQETEANIVANVGTGTPENIYAKSLIGSTETLLRKIEDYSNAGVGLYVMTCLAEDLPSFERMMEKFYGEIAPSFT